MRITDNGSPTKKPEVRLWKRLYLSEVRYYIEYSDGRMIVLNDGATFDAKDVNLADYRPIHSITIEVDA